MRFNRKGLSDVITTVLIILVVLAAVALIASFVLNQVGSGTATASGQTQCLTQLPSLTLSSCNKATNATTYQFTGDLSKVVSINITGTNSSGSFVASLSDTTPSAGETVTLAGISGAAGNGGSATTKAYITVKDTNGASFACGTPTPSITCV